MKGTKTGGRKKGTPNKSTEELKALATEIGVNPAKFLLLVLKGDLRDFGYVFLDDEIFNPELAIEDPEGQDANLLYDKRVGATHPKHLIPLEMRISVAESLLPHFEAKRKAIEIYNEDPEEPPQFVINLNPKKSEE